MQDSWFTLLQLYLVCGLLVIVFLAIVGSILYALLINQRLLGGVMIRVRWKKDWKPTYTGIAYSYRFNGFVLWRSCNLTDFSRTQFQNIIGILRLSENYGLCSLFRR